MVSLLITILPFYPHSSPIFEQHFSSYAGNQRAHALLLEANVQNYFPHKVYTPFVLELWWKRNAAQEEQIKFFLCTALITFQQTFDQMSTSNNMIRTETAVKNFKFTQGFRKVDYCKFLQSILSNRENRNIIFLAVTLQLHNQELIFKLITHTICKIDLN